MKKKELLLIFLFILSGFLYYSWASSKTNIEEYLITRIIDGDTVELENSFKIRMLGINTPEKNMLHSELATEFLINTILNKTVKIEIIESDKYGRKLSYIFLNNDNINKNILEKGYAHLYYYDKDKYYDELYNAEFYARKNNLGIWNKSINYDCINLVELKYNDDIYGNETLILSNNCGKKINVIIKDDATHIYKRTLNEGIYSENFSHIFNQEGDSLYIWDDIGLVEFFRY